jgi:hypothetical protein
MRLTCPEGSLSNSVKLTADIAEGGGRVHFFVFIMDSTDLHSVLTTFPLTARSLSISGGTATGNEKKSYFMTLRRVLTVYNLISESDM